MVPPGQRDKELAAIGSSIGCNCRPCVDHHIPKGREAGLSEADLDDRVATARAVRNHGIEQLAPRIDELGPSAAEVVVALKPAGYVPAPRGGGNGRQGQARARGARRRRCRRCVS